MHYLEVVTEVLLGCRTRPRRRGKETVKRSQPKTRGLQGMMQACSTRTTRWSAPADSDTRQWCVGAVYNV
jgi:hypothetical protein